MVTNLRIVGGLVRVTFVARRIRGHENGWRRRTTWWRAFANGRGVRIPLRIKPVENRKKGCALLRKKFKDDLFTYCIENGILQYSFEPSNDNTNVVNALQEPFIVKQDPGENSSQSPPQINHHCCYECGDSLEDIFCHQCTCELCGRGAHYGTVPSFDPTGYSEDGNSFTYDLTSNLVHESPNVFDPPLQPSIYSYEFCGNDAYYGHNCSLQDCTIAITPILSTKELDNSLSMGDEHLDTIPATESDEFIKSNVENLVPIPSETEGNPGNMCDVPFHDNSSPLDVSKYQFEDFSDSNDDSTSIDDESFSIDNIEYVEASPPDSELVSLEVMEIVIPEVGGIDDDILLTIKDDILREKLLNINLLIANIEAIIDNPTPSSDFMTNGSTTTRSDISLPDYETFYDDHVKKISSGSTTTHSDYSLYDSFIFDLPINPFPPADMRDFTMDVVEDIFPTREPRVYVHNVLHTHPTFQLNLDFIISSESLFTYVVWIFLPFFAYSAAPQYLLSFGNEDTIFDLGICNYHISSFMPDESHRNGTFKKINVQPKHLNESPMEILISTCSPMDQGIRGRVRLKTRLTKTSASWEASHAYP
uniref:Uncharacterized protein n=1 Tax=Tanacetum cinerariifolium TaxID=118510 RepID=A0A6L2NNK2_TANCI|nr:hypothetical protein [Tanacetum cinerariifolium]